MKLYKLFRDYPDSVDNLKTWIMNSYGLCSLEHKVTSNDSLLRFLLPVFFPTRTFDEVSYLLPMTVVRLFGLPKDTLFMCKEDWDSVFLSKDVDIVLFIV